MTEPKQEDIQEMPEGAPAIEMVPKTDLEAVIAERDNYKIEYEKLVKAFNKLANEHYQQYIKTFFDEA